MTSWNEKKVKNLRFLKIANKELSKTFKLNQKKSEKKPRAGAGEQKGTKDLGLCKSFKFQVDEKGHHPQMLKFLEDMNDIRFHITQKIKDKLENYEEEGRDIEDFFQNEEKNKRPIEYDKKIRELTESFLKNEDKYDRYNKGKIPYWIAHDLGGKIKSYIQLHKMSGGKKKNIFMKKGRDKDTWTSIDKDEMKRVLNNEIIKNITGKSPSKNFTLKDLYNWSLRKTLEILQDRFDSFSIDEKGKIQKMIGSKGVGEHNIIVNQMNIYIGQYKGQATNIAIEKFSEKYNCELKLKGGRGVFKWIATQETKKQECLKEEFKKTREEMGAFISKLYKIKKYPSFPSFHPAEDYKKGTAQVVNIDDYFRKFNDLKKEIERNKFCQINTLKKEFQIDDSRDFTKDFLKNKYEEICDRQLSRTKKMYLITEGDRQDNLEAILEKKPEEIKSKGYQSLSGQKRFLRKVAYFDADIQKAVDQETQFLLKRIERIKSSRLGARKMRHLAYYMGRCLRLLLNSRKTMSKKAGNSLSEFDRGFFLEEIKKLSGDLQMEGMKVKRFQRFSFQFRQFDQSGLYLVIEKTKNNRQKFKFYFKAYQKSQKKRGKY